MLFVPPQGFWEKRGWSASRRLRLLAGSGQPRAGPGARPTPERSAGRGGPPPGGATPGAPPPAAGRRRSGAGVAMATCGVPAAGRGRCGRGETESGGLGPRLGGTWRRAAPARILRPVRSAWASRPEYGREFRPSSRCRSRSGPRRQRSLRCVGERRRGLPRRRRIARLRRGRTAAEQNERPPPPAGAPAASEDGAAGHWKLRYRAAAPRDGPPPRISAPQVPGRQPRGGPRSPLFPVPPRPGLPSRRAPARPGGRRGLRWGPAFHGPCSWRVRVSAARGWAGRGPGPCASRRLSRFCAVGLYQGKGVMLQRSLSATPPRPPFYARTSVRACYPSANPTADGLILPCVEEVLTPAERFEKT